MFDSIYSIAFWNAVSWIKYVFFFFVLKTVPSNEHINEHSIQICQPVKPNQNWTMEKSASNNFEWVPHFSYTQLKMCYYYILDGFITCAIYLIICLIFERKMCLTDYYYYYCRCYSVFILNMTAFYHHKLAIQFNASLSFKSIFTIKSQRKKSQM